LVGSHGSAGFFIIPAESVSGGHWPRKKIPGARRLDPHTDKTAQLTRLWTAGFGAGIPAVRPRAATQNQGWRQNAEKAASAIDSAPGC